MRRKKAAWKKMLQEDVPEEERERRSREYIRVKKEIKRLVV